MLEQPPYSEKTLTDDGSFSRGWVSWIDKVKLFAGSVAESGTTADRPTSRLFVGRQYFDTDLGYSINVKSLRPTVWVNGAGTTV